MPNPEAITVLNVATDIEEIQATMLRALASPNRLRILDLVGHRAREVNEITEAIGVPQSAVSQHLAALRSVGLVEATRDGRRVRYSLADPEILAACSLMRSVIVRRLTALGRLAAASSVVPPDAASLGSISTKSRVTP